MANALRTDYIFAPSVEYDPMRSTRNALAIQQQQNVLAQQQLANEALQQQNVLRGGDISMQPFRNEVEIFDFYNKVRPFTNERTYPQVRQMFISKGLNPAMMPEKFDPKWIQSTDSEMAKFLAGEYRRQLGFESEQERQRARFEREERQRQRRFEREEKQAAAKFKREQSQLKGKEGDKATADRAESARKFIQSFSTGSESMISIYLANLEATGTVDPQQKAAAKAEVPPEQRAAYEQAIRIYEEYLGVAPITSQVQRMQFTREGGLQPIQ